MRAVVSSEALADGQSSSSPVPGAVRAARLLLRIESAVWLVLGTLLIVGGLIVLNGGGGVPGLVHSDEPGFALGIGRLTVGLGGLVAVLASWGIWTGWAMRRLTTGVFISAVLYCAVWIVVGLVWVSIATTPIPGMITLIVNAAILLGLAGWSSSRRAFRG